jgi:hypothetical protein
MKAFLLNGAEAGQEFIEKYLYILVCYGDGCFWL